MLDVMKSVPAVFRAWLAVSLLVMLLISCSSSTPPGGGGGENTPPAVYAGITDCYLCHADGSIDRFDGMQIFSKWLDGPHSNNESVPPVNHPYNTGFPDFEELDNEPGCSLDCHDQLGDGESLEDFWIATGIDYLGRVNRPVVGCESCHGEGADHAGTVGKASLEHPTPDRDRCGQCHDVYFDVGPLIIHNGLYDIVNIVITDTHYDDPATDDIVEGYTMSLSKERACLDCHDVHSVDTTINRQWGESGHAGHILEAKEEAETGNGDMAEVIAVKAAGVHEGDPADPGFSPAWVLFNWDSMATPPPPPFPDKKPCQRCHTATGAKNYLDDPDNYNSANNDYSHLDGWAANPTGGSDQNELLYCWGCHDSVRAGTLRDPGSITADYVFEDGADEFPDVTSSNVCVACHAGLGSGQDVKAVLNAEIVSQNFIDSHYLAAAGILFKAIGYEYGVGTGADFRFYDNLVFFAHDELGTVAADVEVRPGTGTSGPCVACHLGNGEVSPDHTMELGGFERGTCGTNGACHDSPPFLLTEVELEEEYEAFENALYALSTILKDKGFEWSPSHPYFDDDTDWTDGGTYTFDQGRQMLGAAFNLNMLLHEPGAFAHNMYYAKRLLIDSLDFAYNGVLETLTENATESDRYDGSDAGAAIQAVVGLTYNDHDGVLQTFLQAQADSAEDYLDLGSDTGFQRR